MDNRCSRDTSASYYQNQKSLVVVVVVVVLLLLLPSQLSHHPIDPDGAVAANSLAIAREAGDGERHEQGACVQPVGWALPILCTASDEPWLFRYLNIFRRVDFALCFHDVLLVSMSCPLQHPWE